jgi:methyl-accepting chemotaxis protein
MLLPTIDKSASSSSKRSQIFEDFSLLAADISELLLLTGECHFVVLDREHILESYPAPHFNLKSYVGMPINPNWNTTQAIMTKQPRLQIVSREQSAFGTPYIGYAVPLIEDGIAIGAFGWTESTDLLDKKRAFVEELHCTSERLATIQQLLAESTRQNHTLTLSLYTALETLQNVLRTISQANLNIAKVIEQIQMLGINAAIEAARANTHSSGFINVANDVRTLSVSSKQLVQKLKAAITVPSTQIADLQAQLEQARHLNDMQLTTITHMTETARQIETDSQQLKVTFNTSHDPSHVRLIRHGTTLLPAQGKLASVQRLAPLLAQAMSLKGHHQVMVFDREKIISSYSTNQFDMKLEEGTLLQPKWTVSQAMQSGKSIQAVINKEQSVLDIGYISYIIPLREEGDVVGALALYESTEVLEKQQSMVQTILPIMQKLSTSNKAFGEQNQFISQENKTIQQNLEALLASFAAISRASQKIIDVAEQTRILGINAAIESTGAGDQGRGFAVIAGEIRTLAESSREYASGVSCSIKTMYEHMTELQAQIENLQQLSLQEQANASEMDSMLGQIMEMSTDIGQILNTSESSISSQ